MNAPIQETTDFAATRKFITSLSESWAKVHRAEIEQSYAKGMHYNPLRSIIIKETDHSRILGDLLNPKGSHGQGAFFLSSFLNHLGIKPVEGDWTVTVEADRIDILLLRHDPLSVVIIENKVCNASDQPGQLYRYWSQQIHQRQPGIRYDDLEVRDRFRVVYLPPGDHALPASHSICRHADISATACSHDQIPASLLDYRSFGTDVADWLRGILNARTDFSEPLRTFLTLYAQIWRP